MDISAYENADIIFDLNNPNLTNELKNRFDYILDGGTTEHVFDYAQALRHIAKMLKVGGKVIHSVPASGYMNHGYYNISPSLFADFYQSNGFRVENLDILLRKHPITDRNSLKNYFATVPDYRVYNIRASAEGFDGYRGCIRCIAKKLRHQEIISNPKQVQWYELSQIDLLREVWSADSGIEYKDAAIGIVGINDIARLFIDVLKSNSNFDRNKIKAFFINESPKQGQLFEGYPVVPISEILNWRLKTIFLATFDRRAYGMFQPLMAQNINIISPEAYNVFKET